MNNNRRKGTDKRKMAKSIKLIRADRKRTNILRNQEQKSIAYLVQKVPSWISSDGLTAIGLFGNIIVASSFVLAAIFSQHWLLLSILGFAINWLGDSLDGRLAYYRNKPRKWYGFALDVTVDWIGIFLIGTGYIMYVPGLWKLTGFFFVVLYGWEMITSQLRYKIGGKYSIDSGIFGPTEVRILLAIIITLEAIVPGSIHNLAALACLLLLISNIVEAHNLLHIANERDNKERLEKEKNISSQHHASSV